MSSTKTKDKKTVDKKTVKKTATKGKATKAQKRKQTKKGKVSKRLDMLLKNVSDQKADRIKLSVADRTELADNASKTKTKELAKRQKELGKTVDLSKRKYNKATRACIFIIALFHNKGLLNASLFTRAEWEDALVKVFKFPNPAEILLPYQTFIHHFYQAYTDSPEFIRGALFKNNSETYDRNGKTYYRQLTRNQGSLSIAHPNSEIWVNALKTMKKVDTLTKFFAKHCVTVKKKEAKFAA